jgi:hypothetical protein
MQRGSTDPRIESMYKGDRYWAIGAVAVLWITILFVFFRMLPESGSSGVVVALAISGGLVLLFNTASIIAMLQHYTDDKQHIYGLDIHYLDEIKRTKRGGGL